MLKKELLAFGQISLSKIWEVHLRFLRALLRAHFRGDCSKLLWAASVTGHPKARHGSQPGSEIEFSFQFSCDASAQHAQIAASLRDN